MAVEPASCPSFVRGAQEQPSEAVANPASIPARTSFSKRPRNVDYVTPWSDDSQLVASILAGSEADFTQLYKAYYPRIYRFALKRLRDPVEAEDVTQEVFMAAHRSFAAYRGNSSLIVWMFGIARNIVNRRFRRAQPPMQTLDFDGEGIQIAQDLAPIDHVVDVRRVMQRCAKVIDEELTPLQRRIFHLKHLRLQSVRSIAAALDKSEDAVKANLYRMRKAVSEGADGLDTILS